jgi:hypothetical protein
MSSGAQPFSALAIAPSGSPANSQMKTAGSASSFTLASAVPISTLPPQESAPQEPVLNAQSPPNAVFQPNLPFSSPSGAVARKNIAQENWQTIQDMRQTLDALKPVSNPFNVNKLWAYRGFGGKERREEYRQSLAQVEELEKKVRLYEKGSISAQQLQEAEKNAEKIIEEAQGDYQQTKASVLKTGGIALNIADNAMQFMAGKLWGPLGAVAYAVPSNLVKFSLQASQGQKITWGHVAEELINDAALGLGGAFRPQIAGSFVKAATALTKTGVPGHLVPLTAILAPKTFEAGSDAVIATVASMVGSIGSGKTLGETTKDAAFTGASVFGLSLATLGVMDGAQQWVKAQFRPRIPQFLRRENVNEALLPLQQGPGIELPTTNLTAGHATARSVSEVNRTNPVPASASAHKAGFLGDWLIRLKGRIADIELAQMPRGKQPISPAQKPALLTQMQPVETSLTRWTTEFRANTQSMRAQQARAKPTIMHKVTDQLDQATKAALTAFERTPFGRNVKKSSDTVDELQNELKHLFLLSLRSEKAEEIFQQPFFRAGRFAYRQINQTMGTQISHSFDAGGAIVDRLYVLGKPVRTALRNIGVGAVGVPVGAYGWSRINGGGRAFSYNGVPSNDDEKFVDNISPSRGGEKTQGWIIGNPNGLHSLFFWTYRGPKFLVTDQALLIGNQGIIGIENFDGKFSINTSTVASALGTVTCVWRFGVSSNLSLEATSRNYTGNNFMNTDILGITKDGNLWSNFYAKFQFVTGQWRVRLNIHRGTVQFLQEVGLGSGKFGVWGTREGNVAENAIVPTAGLQRKVVPALHFFTVGYNKQYDRDVDIMGSLQSDGTAMLANLGRSMRGIPLEEEPVSRPSGTPATQPPAEPAPVPAKPVPAPAKPQPASPEKPFDAPFTTAPKGQTIWRYYEDNAPSGLSFAEYERTFRQYNNLGSSAVLQAGQQIVLPQPLSAGGTVVVKSGQTAISYFRLIQEDTGDYQAWLKRFQELNAGKVGPNFEIYPGDVLKLPEAAVTVPQR